MTRSPSVLAQLSFDAYNKLKSLHSYPNRAAKSFARRAEMVVEPLAKRLGRHHTVKVRLYGHELVIPAEHFLPDILRAFPQFNRPLALVVEAVAMANQGYVSVIDVGANIGDSAASIEHHLPNKCFFLCLEPDGDLAHLCKLNHAKNKRVEVKRCYIGENEGVAVCLKDDGRANPSTRSDAGEGHDHLVRLDTVAGVFARTHGLHIIKTDTEGYDFSVLRSAPNLLSNYKPAIYFEWFPGLLRTMNEQILSGFEYLAEFGYRHFVFFTSQGDFYCQISDPDSLSLENLAQATSTKMEYFDVCASVDKEIIDRVAKISFSGETDGLAPTMLVSRNTDNPPLEPKDSRKPSRRLLHWRMPPLFKKILPRSVLDALRQLKGRIVTRDLPSDLQFEQSTDDRSAAALMSIIVPIHDAPEVTRRCLASLEKYAAEAQIILVDDASRRTKTRKVIDLFCSRNKWPVVRHEKSLGHSAACWTGVGLATRPYLCLLNSDTVVTPWCWRRIKECFESDAKIGVAGPSSSNAGNLQTLPMAKEFCGYWNDVQIWDFASRLLIEHQDSPVVDLPWISGCAFFIRRTVWDELGGLDRNLPDYGNEVELCKRVGEKGHRMVWVRDSYIHHFGQQSYRDTIGEDAILARMEAGEAYVGQEDHSPDL